MPIARFRLSAGAWRPWKYGTARVPIPAGRDGLVAGVHKPTPETVGVLPGTTFTETGNGSTLTLAPGTYEGRVFLGQVAFQPGQTYVIRNCWFAGADPDHTQGYGSVIRNYGSNPANVTLIDVTIDPSYWVTAKGRTRLWPELAGFHGGNVNIQRCEIKNVCDGVDIHSTIYPVTIELSWLHKGTYATGTQNTGHSDRRVHSDGVQFFTGKNITIRGNVIGGMRDMVGYQTDPFADAYNSGDDFENAAMLIKQEVDNSTPNRIENVLVELNWLGGGMATLNFPYGSDRPNTFASTVVRNNVFMVRAAGWGITRRMDGNLRTENTNGGLGWYILRSASLAATITGNVLETGTPAPISNG